MKIPLLPAEDDDKWVRSYIASTAWTGVVDDTGSHGAFVQNHSPYIPASALVSRYVGEAANGKPAGFGVYSSTSGVYAGQRHGPGVYRRADDAVNAVYYRNNDGGQLVEEASLNSDGKWTLHEDSTGKQTWHDDIVGDVLRKCNELKGSAEKAEVRPYRAVPDGKLQPHS